MVCPNCGRVLEIGEICKCQAINVANREAELANEREDYADSQKIAHDKLTKEKSEKMKAAAEKADAAVDSAMNFGKRMLECFKHMEKIDELYTNNTDTKTCVILIIAHVILNFLLVFLALRNSPLSIIFAAMSMFDSRVESALVIGAISICVIPMLTKMGMMKWKAQDKMLANVSSEYIYTIPVTLLGIIIMLINGTFGIVTLLPIIVFGTIWTYRGLVMNGMDEYKSILAVTACSLVMSIASLIICNLIA